MTGALPGTIARIVTVVSAFIIEHARSHVDAGALRVVNRVIDIVAGKIHQHTGGKPIAHTLRVDSAQVFVVAGSVIEKTQSSGQIGAHAKTHALPHRAIIIRHQWRVEVFTAQIVAVGAGVICQNTNSIGTTKGLRHAVSAVRIVSAFVFQAGKAQDRRSLRKEATLIDVISGKICVPEASHYCGKRKIRQLIDIVARVIRAGKQAAMGKHRGFGISIHIVSAEICQQHKRLFE